MGVVGVVGVRWRALAGVVLAMGVGLVVGGCAVDKGPTFDELQGKTDALGERIVASVEGMAIDAPGAPEPRSEGESGTEGFFGEEPSDFWWTWRHQVKVVDTEAYSPADVAETIGAALLDEGFTGGGEPNVDGEVRYSGTGELEGWGVIVNRGPNPVPVSRAPVVNLLIVSAHTSNNTRTT
jgi:hypothetical protein